MPPKPQAVPDGSPRVASPSGRQSFRVQGSIVNTSRSGGRGGGGDTPHIIEVRATEVVATPITTDVPVEAIPVSGMAAHHAVVRARAQGGLCFGIKPRLKKRALCPTETGPSASDADLVGATLSYCRAVRCFATLEIFMLCFQIIFADSLLEVIVCCIALMGLCCVYMKGLTGSAGVPCRAASLS